MGILMFADLSCFCQVFVKQLVLDNLVTGAAQSIMNIWKQVQKKLPDITEFYVTLSRKLLLGWQIHDIGTHHRMAIHF